MTTLWLPFLIGLTTGITAAWLVPLHPRRHPAPTSDYWSVAAIASRIERDAGTCATSHSRGLRRRSSETTSAAPRKVVAAGPVEWRMR
ncbi:hypothetical protein VMT65_28675 [Nocardia sp. CDC153]|uniref:hypothetical protein n=1 Tax=Nocardia sp. CDC153 TaxID=3112167 RepID=UPI002DBBC52E|nr:hypothetical protein [Nocardia sp. CDC153]MEC3957042.1 hypothetical protein [Nocardia sp. CDC153]